MVDVHFYFNVCASGKSEVELVDMVNIRELATSIAMKEMANILAFM